MNAVTPPETEAQESGLKWYAKALIGFHLFAITVWALPNPPDPVLQGKEQPRGTQKLLLWNGQFLKSQGFLQAYLFSTGTWQYWDMFAPNPSDIDFKCEATVTLQNGQTITIDYPTMRRLSIPEKFVKERYRKFFERLRDDAQSFAWPAFGQRLAVKVATDPDNRPLKVSLTRSFYRVQGPGKVTNTEHKGEAFFLHIVDQQRLAQAKGWPVR